MIATEKYFLNNMPEIACLDALNLNRIEQRLVGGNNVIYKASSVEGHLYAIKCYSNAGASERLTREYAALSFLAYKNVHRVPRVRGRDDENQMGVYDWIIGRSITHVRLDHMDQMVTFLVRLKELSEDAEAKKLALAKDACTSATDLFQLIEARFERLKAMGDEHSELKEFVFHDCMKAYERLKPKAEGLKADKLTLSPSDYGFHNVLEASDGQLSFIDFEYFGWDDPVKMVSDFLWHPGQALGAYEKRYFKNKMEQLFPEIKQRLDAFFPLYGIVWVLILLNNFIPSVWQERLETGVVSGLSGKDVLNNQKKKAAFFLEQALIYGG